MSSPTFVSPPEETETRMAQAEVEESRDGNETSSHGAVEPDVISDTFAQVSFFSVAMSFFTDF